MNKSDKRDIGPAAIGSEANAGTVAPIMSQRELAGLGDGEIAYIRVMTGKEARDLFPTIEDLPADADLYALHGADGTPIALTDSRSAALGHALEGELQIAAVH